MKSKELTWKERILPILCLIFFAALVGTGGFLIDKFEIQMKADIARKLGKRCVQTRLA
jgi:hypothetical protein